ncbi:MAG: hypothetical protein MHPSP_004427, partial [Paramarteilia canceri]
PPPPKISTNIRRETDSVSNNQSRSPLLAGIQKGVKLNKVTIFNKTDHKIDESKTTNCTKTNRTNLISSNKQQNCVINNINSKSSTIKDSYTAKKQNTHQALASNS